MVRNLVQINNDKNLMRLTRTVALRNCHVDNKGDQQVEPYQEIGLTLTKLLTLIKRVRMSGCSELIIFPIERHSNSTLFGG